MEIKNYDDMIVVECNKDKFGHLFSPLMSRGSKWINISGKNFFATTINNYAQLKLIVDDMNRKDVTVDKYSSNIELKLKEEYYKSFDCHPLNFSAELRRRSKKSSKSLSSSVYDDDDTSSDGFPSPGTPGIKKRREDDEEEEEADLEYIINKINELEERIEKLEDINL